jgi:hypothetical protein
LIFTLIFVFKAKDEVEDEGKDAGKVVEEVVKLQFSWLIGFYRSNIKNSSTKIDLYFLRMA